MGHPATRQEVLLQQISDSLVEIAGLLRPTSPEPTAGPVPVDGMGEAPRTLAKKTTRKRAAKKSSSTKKPVKGD